MKLNVELKLLYLLPSCTNATALFFLLAKPNVFWPVKMGTSWWICLLIWPFGVGGILMVFESSDILTIKGVPELGIWASKRQICALDLYPACDRCSPWF